MSSWTSDWLKKNVCACLINRYFSQFIESAITKDQLNLDLYNGLATAERISLAVETLNELSEKQNWPVEFIDGHVDKINVHLPWSRIFHESTIVEVCGLTLTVQPKERTEDATSMFESMWNSMTSSLHLAEEYAKTQGNILGSGYEGVESFAKVLEYIFKKIKIQLKNIVINIENLPKNSIKGVGLRIDIESLTYSDENPNDNPPSNDDGGGGSCTSKNSKKAYLVDSFTTKVILIEGIDLSTIEFSNIDRYASKTNTGVAKQSDQEQQNDGNSEHSNQTDEDDLYPERHTILFGRFYNTQEIKIRLKESEDISGPKVTIEINCAALILFLSPRQFHILIELLLGFTDPCSNNQNIPLNTHCQSRPMTEQDYEKVQEQLGDCMNHLSKFKLCNPLLKPGWATGALEDSIDDNEYVLMTGAANAMYDSSATGISSSMDSSMSSSVTSSATDNTSHSRKANHIDTDPTAEISRFQIHLAMFAAIILHEDVLNVPTNNEIILVKQMINTVNEFFKKIHPSLSSQLGCNSFRMIHQILDNSCCSNHTRLVASPIQVEGDEKTTASAFSIFGHLTAHKLELIECLRSNGQLNHIPLFTFTSPSTSTSTFAASSKPNVKLKFKHIQKTGRKISKNFKPRTDLALYLDKCTIDFDISIIDRITAILNHSPITNLYESRNSRLNIEDDGNTFKSMCEFKIFCELVNFKIRFPIPDFRAAHDLSKVPWWERSIRSDYIALIFHQFTFGNVINQKCDFDEYLLKCKLLDIYYYESETAIPLHIARSGSDDKSTLPTKLSIKLRSKNLAKNEIPVPDPMAHSFCGAFEMGTNCNNGPFGAKKVWHESDTSHNDLRKDATEELVIPGDRNELKNFIESTISESKLSLEFSFPIVFVHLQSKHVYELIYNRISNDLLVWMPGAPKPCFNSPYKTEYGIFKDFDTDEDYVMANSGLQNDDSDSSDDSDSTYNNIFYSTYDTKSKMPFHLNQMANKEKKSQSDLALSFSISEGLLCLNPPVRDSGSNVIPGQQGELLLDIKDANVFIVNGYKGQKDIGYICVQISDAQLFHCDMKPMPNSVQSLKDRCLASRKNQLPLICKSNVQSLASFKNIDTARDMFSAAIKIQSNHETHHVKVFTVSLGIYGATLKHKMCKEPNTWISQMIDFFTVQDYPIHGYIPKDVLTELHLNLWNCLIDYRPFYMPLRSVVTIGNFSLSSHLTVASNMSTLRLIFEDCGLFLSEKYPPRNGTPSNVPIDLRKDYVNVVDLPLLEISIKTTDKKSGKHPHIDLRASSNILNIRTCSDSARALFELLIYYINDGDLSPETDVVDDFDSHSDGKIEEQLVKVNETENVVPKNQQEQIVEMLEEAMQDNDNATNCVPSVSHQPRASIGAKLFYFPDEKEMLEDSSHTNLPQFSSDLGEINPYHFSMENDEEEFCILGNEEYPFYPKDGIPEITWLTNEPVKIIEQHMAAPVGKKDVLEAPKGFPVPVNSYTLCEMSIMWQWFGGSDFTATSDSNKKEVRFADKCFDGKVRFSNIKEQVTIGQRTDTSCWIKKGGINRDQNVLMELQLNKIRFKHEIYPETTREASRQALTISEIEIRDRLESSQINKFLYQYSSQSRPKKSHSNMVLIRALHIRPDSKLKTQECLLKIALLPIKLNIDQDALFFMIKFFKELSGESTDSTVTETSKEASLQSTPTHQPPIMSVSLSNDDQIKQRAKQTVNENLILLESRYHADIEEISETVASNNTDDSPIYFKHVEFARDVFIRLDYHGKRVDMSHGPIAGLLIGLGQLNCSEIKLKRIVHRHGLLGLNKLLAYLLQEWINDIKRNQLSTILAGVGIMFPVSQLLHGFRDLFWLPIEQYQKDGRIVRGLQKGANSFTTSTAMAALELTTRIIYLIQITAETAYDMLSPGPSIRMKKIAKQKGRKKKHYQAQDIREGLTNACQVVKDGFGETAENIFTVAVLEKEQKGITGAVGAVIRQIPATVIKPIVIATEATNNLLGGVQSQFVPDAKTEANQKWRSND